MKNVVNIGLVRYKIRKIYKKYILVNGSNEIEDLEFFFRWIGISILILLNF